MERFYTPVQAGPRAHPDSCIIGTVSFQRVKRAVFGVDHPPHLGRRLMKDVNYTSIHPHGFHGRFYDKFFFLGLAVVSLP